MSVCFFIPPYILRHIAERGDDEQRARANATLDFAADVRAQRAGEGAGAPLNPSDAGMLGGAPAPPPARRIIYDAENHRRLPGARVRAEGERKVRDDAANEAYDGSGKTYDFFASVLDRNSINGRGLRLESTVHFGRRFENAMWNGRQMIYGDGDGTIFNRFTKSLDVIAHELTHGVTQYSAALGYDDQPGALNEHFSDVFGSLVRQHSLKQSAAKADWLIGAELLAKGIHGQAIRSMKAPGTAYDDPLLGKDPQPSHMRDYVHGDEDNGGVHINNGIPNHVFYRVATLLGGNAWEVAGKIWYRALTHKLRSHSHFQDCATATFEAAGEMYGVGSEPQKVIDAAWKSVGIDCHPERERGDGAEGRRDSPTSRRRPPAQSPRSRSG